MANTLHGTFIDRTSTTSSRKTQGPFLNKLKSGLAKLINRHHHSSIVDTFRPSKYDYSPAQQDSDDDDSEDDLDSISDIRINSEYPNDDDVERIRYNKATGYQHQRSLRPSTISLLSPDPTILVKQPSTHSSTHHRYTNNLQNSTFTASSASQHRYTNSLQGSSIISTSGSISYGNKTAHYHHSRHHSHISFMSTSNMTVNSEDLTAKEFADMAGIRIIPDSNDDDTGDQPDDMTTNSTRMAVSTSLAPGGHQQRPPYCSNQTSNENDWSVVSLGSQQSGLNAETTTTTTNIWDTEFWRQPCTETRDPTLSAVESCSPRKPIQQSPALKNQRSALLQHRQNFSLQSSVTATVPSQHAKSKSNCDFPIIHELRRIHSNYSNRNQQQHDNNNTNGDPCVIRKGRFEIQLEP